MPVASPLLYRETCLGHTEYGRHFKGPHLHVSEKQRDYETGCGVMWFSMAELRGSGTRLFRYMEESAGVVTEG